MPVTIRLTKREAEAILRVLSRGEDEIVEGDLENNAYEYDRPGLTRVTTDIRLVKNVRSRIQEQLS
jgi:hypothetical protein